MSLRVWLPLDGNLRNLGISKVDIISGTAAYGAGKINGSALSYINSTTNLELYCEKLNNISTFSICFWAKSLKDTSDTDWASPIHFGVKAPGSSTINKNFRFGKDNRASSTGYPIGVFHNSGNIIASSNHALTTSADWNTWVHISFICDGTHVVGYKNGIQVFSNNNGQNGILSGNIYLCLERSNSYINDLRIYDHCLSAAEVHEISQGLILHYKLDSFYNGYGNPNLCKNSRTFGTGWSGSGTVTQNAFEGFAVKYKDNTNGTNYTDTVVYNNVLTVNPSEVYTVSFWAKADTAHNIVCYFYNNTSGVVQSARSIASTGASGTSSDGSTTIALTTQWEYYWITWTFKDSGTAAAKTLLLGRNYASNSGISIAKVKLEHGDTPSDWAPHPDDNEAVQQNYVTDSSGYGHIGKITGSPQLSSPAPRYNHCVNLTDRQTISTEGLFTTPNPIFSINFWVKTYANTYTTWSDVVSFSGNKIFRMETSLNTGLRLSWFNYPIGTSSGILNANVNYDEWNMLTLTWSDTSITTYKNGVQAAQVAVSGTEWIPNGQFKIGDAGMYMYISDVRIYCTALQPNDILQLYHTSAKVDNKQKLHTFELVENQNKIAIDKQGRVLCKELTENTNTKFYKTDQAIDTEQIIEF